MPSVPRVPRVAAAILRRVKVLRGLGRNGPGPDGLCCIVDDRNGVGDGW